MRLRLTRVRASTRGTAVIPVSAGDQMAKALQDAAAERAEGKPPLKLRYVRYAHAPGPPISEFAQLVGHGSYELAYRDSSLYDWLQQQQCARCGRPLAKFHELPEQDMAFGRRRR